MVRAPRRPRLLKGGEVDFKLRRNTAWLERLPSLAGKAVRARKPLAPKPERLYGRRSVVKASYHSNFRKGKFRSGLMEAWGRYLETAHGKQKGEVELGYDALSDTVPMSATAHNWALARDKLHWRIILSPDDVDRIDLKQHVREVMAQMEKDLGTELKWMAIEHTDTDHRHAHIFLRGVRQEVDREGKCLTLMMPREYVSRGIREISQELVERELGLRNEREYLEARARSIEGERWTEIDRRIERHLQRDDIVDYRFISSLRERTRSTAQQDIERLAFLEGMGLARRLGRDRWQMEPDWKDQLKELQLSRDVIKDRARKRIHQREMEQELA